MDPRSTEPNYRLIEEIRSDGAGALFTAHHRSLRRTETLRILPPNRTDDEVFVAHLREIARRMAMLAHPHVAPVYGFGRLQDGRFYLAMEYLEGDSLQTLISREGAQPEGLTRRLLYQLANAIGYAHEQGIVHSHLSPCNVMLIDQDGVAPNIKVREFGLASILESTHQAASSPGIAGTVYGQPGFMAPERVAGEAPTPSVDVYSFGCVAYTVITGQPPIPGMPFSNLADSAFRQDLIRVVIRCLEPDPSARYMDGTELRAALQALDGFHGEPTWRHGFPGAPPTTIEENAKTIRRERFPQVRTVLDDAPERQQMGEQNDLECRRYEDLLKAAGASLRAGSELSGCLADLRKVEEQLDEKDLAREHLHALGEATFRSFRRKESLLRFELGELSFQQAASLSAEDRARVDSKLNELTEELVRIEYLHARELRAISNREVGLASARHEFEERRRALWDTFDGLVASSEEG